MSKGLCPSSRVTMCLSMWSVLENAYMCLKKNVYFRDVMSRKYQLSLLVLLCVIYDVYCVLIFCLENLSIDVSGALKSPIIIFRQFLPLCLLVFVLLISVLLD